MSVYEEIVNYEQTIQNIRKIVMKWYNDQATGDECVIRILKELGI